MRPAMAVVVPVPVRSWAVAPRRSFAQSLMMMILCKPGRRPARCAVDPGGPRQVDYWSWSSVLLASGRDRDIAIGHARPWFGSIGCSAPYTALPCSGPRRTSAYVFEPAYGYICTCVLCT
jgi:hypothetical protein